MTLWNIFKNIPALHGRAGIFGFRLSFLIVLRDLHGDVRVGGALDALTRQDQKSFTNSSGVPGREARSVTESHWPRSTR